MSTESSQNGQTQLHKRKPQGPLVFNNIANGGVTAEMRRGEIGGSGG